MLEGDVDRLPTGKRVIIGLGSVESNFVITNTPCFNSTQHPDYAPLMLFVQYLTQLEVI